LNFAYHKWSHFSAFQATDANDGLSAWEKLNKALSKLLPKKVSDGEKRDAKVPIFG
jgi:hypothetical protein